MFTKADIEKYFNAEKAESWVFLGIGAAGIIAAIVFFFFLKANFYKGAAIPLVAIGLILSVVGITVYRSSDRQRTANVYAYGMNPSGLKEKEIPRMQTVMKNFIILRWIEIFLFAAGAGLYIYFIRDIRHDFWRGFGLALAIMAILALAADYFAEKRGHLYLEGLQSFTSK
jgi:uncharacterized membrane protein YhaH (DUF805 family)